MKRAVMILMMMVGIRAGLVGQGQNKAVDGQRMERDIEVAENVLGTLIRQQLNKRNFFPFDVEGVYSPGYGVTFRLPMDFGGPMMFGLSGPPAIVNVGPNKTYSYSWSTSSDGDTETLEKEDCEDCEKIRMKNSSNDRARNKGNGVRVTKSGSDSLSKVINDKIIAAAKEFIADYGDLISQLSPEERIKITNRNDGQRFWYAGANAPRRKFISLEGTKADVNQFKQGKITRDQLMNKITVVDSETSDEMSPDLELLSSMFNRLFRSDLSKSYYIQENIYYERLKDYGVVYYMQVVSSIVNDYRKYSMPTVDLEGIDKETRDKKVKELYPVFERDVKESMLDYGRTLKSLKDDELLVFNIKLTQCEACAIPSTLELSVKYSVLKDFGSGKLTKEAALEKISVKKGANQ